MHKINKEEVAEIGGIPVFFSFLLGLFFYIGTRTFLFNTLDKSLEIFALLTSLLIIAFIGIIDDILGWKIGLKQYQKPLLCLIAALPLMVTNIGQTTMDLPFIGIVDLGLYYTFLFIPLIISGAANGFNMLAGYNGLETGQAILILSTQAFFVYKTGFPWLTVFILCMVSALIGFLYYNKYPSKIFPGDALTYTQGALIGAVAITGNVEKLSAILFIPYFIEFILKARGKFKKESFAIVDTKKELNLRYEKIYGLEHLAILFLKKIKIKSTEKNVVYSLYLFQTLFILISLILFL